MLRTRMLGNYVAYLANINNISNIELSNIIGCSEHQVNMFLRGRAFLSYSQIQKLSTCFSVSVKELLRGNRNIYNETVVHCNKSFVDENNREFILNIINDYVDIVEAVQFNNGGF